MSQTPNLTRDEASRRAAALTVHSYQVDINLTDGAGGPSENTFAVSTTITFDATESESWIDFVGDAVRSAQLNGSDLDCSGWTSGDGLQLTGLGEHNELRVDAVGRYMNTGEGLHRFVDPEDGAVYLYSQFETADAKRVFPCFDQPDLKARFTFTVTAPDGWQVITNGAATSQQPDSTGAQVHHFATTEPISTYITALVAGPYHMVREQHDGIDLGLFCRRSLAEFLDAERLFTETKQGFDFFHTAFGVRYPFGKYDQLFVPEFNAGAMENAGAVTFREEYVFRSKVTGYLYERRCETILHEMAHMWFGDLVTMKWWDDLWLNESFATWASVVAQDRATDYSSPWTTFANAEKSWAYVQDQLPSTHPIAADMVDLEAVEVNFDGITYAKGASVLKQLAAYVGYEEFLTGLRNYFAAHAFGNATLSDLLRALEATSGRDLAAWSDSWLTTTGLNTLSAEISTDDNGIITSFAVIQGGAAPGAGELRPHRIAIGLYDDVDGALVRTHREELDVTGARTEVACLVGLPRGKIVLVNDDDLTYCKLRLDPDSLACARARIADIADSLPRTLVWSAAWEMTRDALMPARDYLSLVVSGLGTETEIGVVQRIIGQAQSALTSYADPAWAIETGWPMLVDFLRTLAETAEPGGDMQLAAVGALASCVLDAETLAAIDLWRTKDAPLPGLVVDQDLSWTLLGALVAHGRAEESDIAVAEAADATASGQRRAVGVRALLPGAAAKRAVWDRLMTDDTMANALQDAAIAGFFHPAQRSDLLSLRSAYFDAIAQVWERRSSEVAQKVAVGLYPRWDVRQDAVDAALAWEADEHPRALKRLVSEGRAGVQRALRARAADMAAG